MSKDGNSLELARTLDRLKACADGQQKKVCLTSTECEKVCAYIWWLADRCAKDKEEREDA